MTGRDEIEVIKPVGRLLSSLAKKLGGMKKRQKLGMRFSAR